MTGQCLCCTWPGTPLGAVSRGEWSHLKNNQKNKEENCSLTSCISDVFEKYSAAEGFINDHHEHRGHNTFSHDLLVHAVYTFVCTA